VQQWARMQGECPLFVCIVDLHSLTNLPSREQLVGASRRLAAQLVACGLEEDKCTLFVQSEVPEHLELAWLLSCHTPVTWLQRMIQFKEKSKKKGFASLGLLAYPILMCADVMLYRATRVPVGEDQRQHLELAAEVVRSTNVRLGADVFPEPRAELLDATARVMSLRDGRVKMSKSDPAESSRIELTDSRDSIAAKIRAARTDSEPGVTYDPQRRPELANLLRIFSAVSRRPLERLVEQYADRPFTDLKRDLTEALIEALAPVQARLARLEADPAYLDRLLREGRERARERATKTMRRVRDLVGFTASAPA
jgi:tryptophanyl-tRNA synthetase